MAKAWLRIKNERGFSPVEVLLAATVFGMIMTAVIGAFIYGRQSTAASGDRARAVQLAEEGNEAVRNIRDAAFSNLADGTYGLVQSGNVWTLSGSSDTTGVYTRQVTVATGGNNRKDVTTRVTWPQGSSTSEVSILSRLTNWMATVRSWLNPMLESSLDLTGTNTGVKVDTEGNYAYVVRTDGTPDFVVLDITAPASPTVVGSLSLAGTPTNVFVSGSYAYVTSTDDSAELQIINVSTPSAPVVTGTYNAPGAADGKGVFVSGVNAFLVRNANSANNEFVLLNVTTPSAPTRTSGYNLNVNMNEIYVYGTTAYIATSSDTQELLVINLVIPTLLTLGTAINLPGTTDATTIDGNLANIAIGQGTALHTVNINLLSVLIPTLAGTITLSGTVNDVTLDVGHNLVVAGTSDTTKELQLINASNLSTPTLYSTFNLTAATTLTGVAYNDSKDRVVGVTSSSSQEAVIFAPN